MTLQFNVEDLVSSAIHVTGQGEDLAIGHQASDGRIATAQTGWQGSSAQAMSARLSAWAQTSTALLGRLGDHAQGLHSCAYHFATNEEQHAQELAALASPV